jgi:hypothetical protein
MHPVFQLNLFLCVPITVLYKNYIIGAIHNVQLTRANAKMCTIMKTSGHESYLQQFPTDVTLWSVVLTHSEKTQSALTR